MWKTPYVIAGLKDKIVVAWGGGLNSDNETGTINYYKASGKKWTKKMRALAPAEKPEVNKGYIFTFAQSYRERQFECAKVKCGCVNLTVFQNKKKGYSTKIISLYAHRLPKPGNSIGISPGGPSIQIGMGWDKTSVRQKNINY